MGSNTRISSGVISIFFHALSFVPLKWGRKLGAWIGWIWYLADKRHREIAKQNLFQVYSGRRPWNEINAIARSVFENLSCILFEIGWAVRLTEDKFYRHFSVIGLSNLKAAHGKNKGVIILTAHIGNWELLPPVIALATNYASNIVYRPLDFKPLDLFFINLRSRYGSKLIPKSRGMRKILSSLHANELVGILFDQSAGLQNGVIGNFLGRRACTNMWLSQIAGKTGAEVVPAFLVRTENGFKAEFLAAIPFLRTGGKEDDILANTQQYNDVIGAFSERHPEQWLWIHRRWRITT
jgi:Kdo2-lipid IVA lauroyltransferase/acyltransferase